MIDSSPTFCCDFCARTERVDPPRAEYEPVRPPPAWVRVAVETSVQKAEVDVCPGHPMLTIAMVFEKLEEREAERRGLTVAEYRSLGTYPVAQKKKR